jgi:hypothetical protein
MAVSGRGRKSTGFQDSLSKGSAEDFDVCCDPCLVAGNNYAEAKGFCLDCQEKNVKPVWSTTKEAKHRDITDYKVTYRKHLPRLQYKQIPR